MAGFGDIFNQFVASANAAEDARFRQGKTQVFGGSPGGQRAAGLVPGFLGQGAQEGGAALGPFFAQAFAQLNDPRRLNAQLNRIAQGTDVRARKVRSVGKFKGSPIGEALAQGVQEGGVQMEQQARLSDEQRRLREGLALAQGFTGSVTNPLLSILGISMGDEQSRAALGEQRRQFDASQPSTFDKILGAVGGILCWTAREVLQDDRWLDARAYIITEASPVTLALYAKNGKALAAKIRTSPKLRKQLTPVFEEFARRGRKYRGW